MRKKPFILLVWEWFQENQVLILAFSAGSSKPLQPEEPGCMFQSPEQPRQGLESARCSDCFLYRGRLRLYFLQLGAKPNQSSLPDSTTYIEMFNHSRHQGRLWYVWFPSFPPQWLKRSGSDHSCSFSRNQARGQLWGMIQTLVVPTEL